MDIDLKIIRLNDWWEPSFREEIIQNVITSMSKLDGETANALRHAIKESVRIDGFRKSSILRAPKAHLIKEIYRHTEVHLPLLAIILKAWEKLNPQLADQIKNFPETSKHIHHEPDEGIRMEFDGYWHVSSLDHVTDEFLNENSEYNRQDVSLMISLLTGNLPLNDEKFFGGEMEKIILRDQTKKQEEMTTLGSFIWDAWLEDLRELDHHASEWQNIDGYLDEVKMIAKGKLHQLAKEKDLANAFNAVKEKLQNETGNLLPYFGIEQKVSAWSYETCSEKHTIVDEVKELTDCLLEYQTLRDKSTQNFLEDQAKQESLNEKGKLVLAFIDRLDLKFQIVNDNNLIVEGFFNEIKENVSDLPSNTKDFDSVIIDHQPSPEVNPTSSPEDQESSVESDDQVFETSETIHIEIQDDLEATTEVNTETVSETNKIFEELQEKPDADELVEPDFSEEEVASPETESEIEDFHLESVKDFQNLNCEFSSQAIAKGLLEEEIPENLEALFWSLIAEDDLAGAYWLQKMMVEEGHQEILAPWLIEALQGSRWLIHGNTTFVSDLLDITQKNQPDESTVSSLLSTAAALRASLIAPYSGLISWLKTPISVPSLSGIINAIHEFASTGITLEPFDILGVSGEAQRKQKLEQTITDARDWLDQAHQKKFKLKRTTDIWSYLSKPAGDLYVLVDKVSKNNQNNLNQLSEEIKKWRSREFCIEQIDLIDKIVYKPRAQSIIGDAREQLLRNIFDACDLLEEWYSQVSHEIELQSRGNWIYQQVDNLRQAIGNQVHSVQEQLSDLDTEASPIVIRAASRSMMTSLYNLVENLKIENHLINNKRQKDWKWLAKEEDTIKGALKRRWLLIPEASYWDEVFQNNHNSQCLQAVIHSLAENRSIIQATQAWLEKQDYSHIETMLNSIDEKQVRDEVSSQLPELREGSRISLRQNIRNTHQVIEQAVVDGIINEERAEYLNEVEAITPEKTDNYYNENKKLDTIRDSIRNSRLERLNHLHERWQLFVEELKSSHLDESERGIIQKQIEMALHDEDTRLAEEYLSTLQDILDNRSKPGEIWHQEIENDIFQDFMESYEKIDRWLHNNRKSLHNIANSIYEGQSTGGLQFNISAKRRDEASRAIKAWALLKKNGSHERQNNQLIEELLRYLGFSPDTGTDAFRVKKSENELLYLQVKMSAGDLARPIPQFGSQAHGLYHVVCLWERPGAEMISSRLRDLRLKLDSVVVFYLGRLTTKQRYDITRISHDQELGIALLDEILLLFLSQESDARLPAFLKCSLPFSSIAPYSPFKAGDVPPEMFFGRESMARDLQRLQGTSLLYGGRQLGKSALLRHVAREFHDPGNNHYARVEDIKLLGNPGRGQNQDILWRKLRDILQEFRLISERIFTDKPDEIIRQLSEIFRKESNLRILIMFDEADNFLDADAKENFKVTEQLRMLMAESQRRFKVVFAGLHNVQRFQGISNQPLAHFGTPIQVGPLEARPALNLITRPLNYLGYRFQDRYGPLRILSYTNYHPGLIQLFCQELLAHLRGKSYSKQPPWEIKQDDIESVYLKIREKIRERFDWTLALDTRYQAVAWTLIEDQIKMRDSYAKAYSPPEILKMVRFWWGKGFNQTQLDEMRAYINEMEGLGVLIGDINGRYRLRSPNLVRLMGTESDVESMLLELGDKEPEITFQANDHHAPNDDRANRYSPFTFSQERLLNARRIGVCLIFASDALGSENIEPALKNFLPGDHYIPGTFEEMDSWIMDGEHLISTLQLSINKYPNVDHTIFIHKPINTNPEELFSLVKGGLDFCQRRISKRKVLRLLYILSPDATWQWLKIPGDTRQMLETRCDVVVSPKKWSEIGIKQRLTQKGKMDFPKFCANIKEATGGWPFLLDKLFDESIKADDLRDYANNLKTELTSNSELRKEFLQKLGVDRKKPAIRLLSNLLKLESEIVPIEFVQPQLFDSNEFKSQEEIEQSLEFLIQMRIIDVDNENLIIDPIVRLLSKDDS